MKKFLLGCLVLILIIAGVGGFLIYKGVGMAKEVAKGMEQTQARVAQLNQQYPFTPPADGVVSAARLDAFLEVEAGTGDQTKEIQQKLDGEKAGVREAFRTGMALATSLGMSEEKIAALEEHQMSPGEFNWTLRQVVGTLQSDAANEDPALQPIAASLQEAAAQMNKNGQGSNFNVPRPSPTALPVMVSLLAERAEALQEVVKTLPMSLVFSDVQSQMGAGQSSFTHPNQYGSGAVPAEDGSTTSALAPEAL